MQVFKENTNRQNLVLLNEIPKKIESKSDEPARSYYDDGVEHLACLKCTMPTCMFFSPYEVRCKRLQDYTYSNEMLVCPVDAMGWDHKNDIPVINNDKCIRCGLCIRRCAISAIFYDHGIIKVNAILSKHQSLKTVEASVKVEHERELLELSKIPKQGTFIAESDSMLKEVFNRLNTIDSSRHNTVVRNLFIGLGCCSSMRRIGDVYTRMDAVYEYHNRFGVIEVEFGRDTLDASRGILDDIAVMHSRYNINKELNDAYVVCLQLPNARQGYWQVVKDIMRVEHICINTITVCALMILLWNNKRLPDRFSSFYLDYDNMNLRDKIEKLIGRKLNVSDKVLGLFEPLK